MCETDILCRATACWPHTGPFTHNALLRHIISHLQIGSSSTFFSEPHPKSQSLYLQQPLIHLLIIQMSHRVNTACYPSSIRPIRHWSMKTRYQCFDLMDFNGYHEGKVGAENAGLLIWNPWNQLGECTGRSVRVEASLNLPLVIIVQVPEKFFSGLWNKLNSCLPQSSCSRAKKQNKKKRAKD